VGKKSSKKTLLILSNFTKPSFVISKSNFSLVWFDATNQFLVVQGNLEKFFIDTVALNELDYQEAIEELVGNHSEIMDLFEAISIDNTNSLATDIVLADLKHISFNDFKVSNLVIGQQNVSVYYDSSMLQILFEAPYVYLKSNFSESDKELTILKKDNYLSLYSNKRLFYTTPKDQFFVLQAQFSNQITEFYHSIDKPNWLCAFHGCAVKNKNKTFLFLGDSGVGKSTLSSLLSLSEYRFVADDLVLMDHDFKVYDNPAAVSVKENAWTAIQRLYMAFNNLETSEKTKGQTKMKFLPLHAIQNNIPKSFNLDCLVWVNYSIDQTNRLTPLDKQQAISRLIPDTWINPKLTSAKAFANWVMEVKTYHLYYHDFDTAKKLLETQL
jgi:hypothetical protein